MTDHAPATTPGDRGPVSDPGGPPPGEDTVEGPLSDKLLGADIDYLYSSGRHYRLHFDDDYRVTFEWVNAPGRTSDSPPFPAPWLPYRAREIRDRLFLVHWIVPEAAIHVTLTIDLPESTLCSSAMMPPNRWEFFDVAEIVSAELR